jgi:ATP-binding cassette subfamily B protein
VLEGPSGGGKSTLGSSGWRNENHVLTGTFAFNLLLGRQRLLIPQDFEEAGTVCGELGLGELLKRMPAGLVQLVGKTG